MPLTIEPIAKVHSPFREKFGVPRQPGLVPAAEGWLEFLPEFASEEALRGIEEFSHLWLIFVFDQVLGEGWQATVRPPRLGGNIRQGVFATRSPYRPNHLGLSCVRNLGIERRRNLLGVRIGGLDLVDGTPVVDIKPYLLYTDAVLEASGGRFQSRPQPELQVVFTPDAEAQCLWQRRHHPDLKELITQVLQQDPRPAYQKTGADRAYGISLYDLNVRWQVDGKTIRVLEILANGRNGRQPGGKQ